MSLQDDRYGNYCGLWFWFCLKNKYILLLFKQNYLSIVKRSASRFAGNLSL